MRRHRCDQERLPFLIEQKLSQDQPTRYRRDEVELVRRPITSIGSKGLRPTASSESGYVRLETQTDALAADDDQEMMKRMQSLEESDYETALSGDPLFDFGFQMPLKPQVKLRKGNSREILEQLFPFWDDGLGRLPRNCAKIYRQILTAVQELYDDSTLDQDKLAYRLQWLLRIAIYCVIETGVDFQFNRAWEYIKTEEDELLNDLLASKNIKVFKTEKNLRIDVKFPEQACRFAAAAHHYPLQVDPAVSPHGVEVKKGGVSLNEAEDVDNIELDELLEREKKGRLSTRVKVAARQFIWWLEINKDANDFVPPTYGYTLDFEQRNWNANRRLGRIFTRYTAQGERVRCDGPLPECIEDKLSLFRQVDRIRLFYLSLNEIVDVESMRKFGILNGWFPLHNKIALGRLRRTWADIGRLLVFSQPINAIRDYFGDETAALCTFQMIYADSLKLPTMLGAAIALIKHPLLQFSWGPRIVRWLAFSFCIFMMTWTTHFTQKWSRYESRQRAYWGLSIVEGAGHKDPLDPLDTVYHLRPSAEARVERLEAYRTSGNLSSSARMKRSLSPAELFARRAISYLLTFAIATLSILIFSSGIIDALSADDLSEHFGVELSFLAIPKQAHNFWSWQGESTLLQSERLQAEMDFKALMLALAIKVYDEMSCFLVLFPGFVSWFCFPVPFDASPLSQLWRLCVPPLTNFEGHSRWQIYRNSAAFKFLVVKITLFFSPLLYIAVVKNSRNACEGHSCVTELRIMLITIFVVEVTWRTIYRVTKILIGMRCMAPRGDREFIDDGKLMLLDGRGAAVVADLQPLAASVGLIAAFSASMTWLPALALAVTLVEVRTAAIQLCFNARRPFPSRGSLGSAWKYTLKAMSFMSIITNAYLLAFETVGAKWSMTAKIVTITAIILIGTGVKEVIHTVYPDAGKKEILLRARSQVMLDAALFGPRGGVEEQASVKACLNDLGYEEPPIVEDFSAKTSL